VAIAGDSSLAHLCALYLAGAGIGRIGLIDGGVRQGSVDALAEDLFALNPEVRVDEVPLPSLAPSPFDILVAAGVAPTTTAGLAGIAAVTDRPLLAAGVRAAQGWLAHHGVGGACAACVSLHEAAGTANGADGEPSPVGVVASLLAFETLAALLGWDEERASWLHYDGRETSLKTVPFAAHPQCTACGGNA
jgi:hypothetical protein